LVATADQALIETCRAAGADVVMSGQGGDALFLQRVIASHALIDFVRLNGLGAAFWGTAYAVAMLTERPVLGILGDAASFLLGVRSWRSDGGLAAAKSRWKGLIGEDALASLPSSYVIHPWLKQAERLPPTKAEQLQSILALRNYYPACGHGIERTALFPLASQPIVELALSTPAYEFIRGGRDRSLERNAFADILPADIVHRTQKGFVSHSMTAALARDFETVREKILDGVLATEGVINRKAAEARFTREQFAEGGELETVLNLMAVEAWLSAWRPVRRL
jgi:asparagine synthase (glutamine-hydrolysing)